ncbi:MAG: IS1595 family transposase [Acholeplasmataceae bacterium]|jgi:transposase
MKVQRHRLKHSELDKILRCFSEDLTATQASKLLIINRNTINKYYNLFRKLIYTHYKRNFYFKNTVVEIDESYYGSKRVRLKNGKLSKKLIVLGIIERGGNAYTKIIPNVKTKTVFEIIKRKVDKSCIICTDQHKSYEYLKVKGYYHFTVNHSIKEYVRGETHTNTIESFWSYVKTRLYKFKGINKKYFHLYIRECEYRFNLRKKDIYINLLDLIKKDSFLGALWRGKQNSK